MYVKGLHCTPLKLSPQPIVAGNIDFRIAGFKAYKANEYKFEPLEGSVKKISKIHSGNESIDTYELSLGEEDKIEKGYSGSAIVSKKSGQVIAVATDRVMSGKQAYAIPLKYLKEVWHELNPKLFDTVTPFVGLSSFNKEDRDYFFGRDEEVQELIQVLKSTDITIIIGDSGSGKSSFAKAGVIPKYIDNSNNPNLYVIEMRPARNPFMELARFITKVCNVLDYSQSDIGYFIDKVKSEEPQAIQSVFEQLYKEDNSELVFYVDQFEELFTMCDDKTQKKFIELLLFLLEHQNNYLSIKILLTMRRDYYNLLREYTAFYKVIETETYLLRRMKDEQLKEVIEKPLEMLSVNPSEIEQLSNIILWDLGDEAKEITLLQIALTETWLHRAEYNHDILEAYVGIGRVTGALSFLATNTLEGLSEKEQELFKYIFIRIVKFNDIGGITRRLADRDEFSDEAWALVQKLASIYSAHQDQQSQLGRLLKLKSSNTKDDEVIELVHEALTTQWATYVNWIKTVNKENRKRIHNVLIDKSKEYKKNPESKHLLSGYALEESRKLLDEEYRPYLSKFEKSFIEKSNKSEARTIFWKRFGVGSLVVLLGLSGYFGYEAEKSESKALKSKEQVLKVLDNSLNRGFILAEANQSVYARFTFRFILKEFKDEKELEKQKIVAKAWYGEALTLEFMKEYAESIKTYSELIQYFVKNSSPDITQYVAKSYYHKALILEDSSEEEAIQTYKILVDKFKGSEDEIVLGHVARAYGRLSWFSLFSKEYKESIHFAEKGLKLKPISTAIEIHLAHAYLLMGTNEEKADMLYLKNIERREDIKKDFEDLKNRNIFVPSSSKVLKLLYEGKK